MIQWNISNSLTCCRVAVFVLLLQSPWLGAVEPPRPEERESLRDDASLRSVCFVDPQQGWAVGDRGAIWYTPDGGEHWLQQQSGVGCRLTCVHFVNPREGWAAGGWYENDTQISRGVLLRTRDGGKKWEPIENELPRLRKIRFSSSRNGIAAGDWSAVHLGSLFLTYDGGRSWQPAPPSESQAVRSIATLGGSVLSLDRGGSLFHAERPESPAERVFNDSRTTCLAATQRQPWIAGRDGLLAVGSEGGRLWKAFPGRATTVDMSRYDLNCIAAAGDNVWIAGVPGDRIFLKTPRNEIVAASSGITAPIHDLFFLDELKGWAACGMGTILHTADGGRTWKPQRGGKRQAAALFVARRAAELPWPMIVSESLEQGFRSMAVIESNDVDSLADPLEHSAAELAMEVFSKLGGCDVFEIENNADDQAYRAAIVKSLATAQPSIVVLSDDLTDRQRSAWLAAATASPSISRVFHAHRGERGDVVVHPSAILPAAGVVVGEAWADAWSILSPGQTGAEVMAADRLLDREPNVRAIESLLHRLPIGAGGLARRLPPHGSRAQINSLQPRTRHGDWIKQLIDACTVADDAEGLFASRLKQLTAQIRPSDRPAFMRRLVLYCRDQEETALYRQALYETAALVPESSIGRWADLLSASIDASEEWTRLPRSLSNAASVAASTNRSSPIAYGSPFEQAAPVVQVAGVDNPTARTIRQTETPDLIWQHQPAGLLSQAAVLGDQAGPSLLAALERLSTAPSAGPWQKPARDQIAARMKQSQGTADINARFATQRPVLDGQPDESLWGPPVPITETTQLRVAYDAEYLYLAITGRFTAAAVASPASQRQRDANLDAVERLSLQIDVDRDLLTSYRLEVDRSGRCRDTCDGFAQWQPMWFVKTAESDEQWNAEIAIRRKDLFSLPIVPGDVWFVRLQTLQPNQETKSAIGCSPIGWRTLLFE